MDSVTRGNGLVPERSCVKRRPISDRIHLDPFGTSILKCKFVKCNSGLETKKLSLIQCYQEKVMRVAMKVKAEFAEKA